MPSRVFAHQPRDDLADEISKEQAMTDLLTDRLCLRQWREEDFGPFSTFWADEDSTRHVGGPISASEAWRRMMGFASHWSLRGFGYYVIELRESGAAIGYCGAQLPLRATTPEAGWGIYEPYRGRGYAKEAIMAAIGHDFARFGWSDVISLISVASVKLV